MKIVNGVKIGLLMAVGSFANDNRPFHVKVAESKDWFIFDDMFKWQSDSTAENVIFLSFESENTRDSSFMVHEFMEISEDYWVFNVNVTTDSVLYKATDVSKKMRLRYHEFAPISSAGRICGTCWFGTPEVQESAWVKMKINTGTGSHEIAHTFKLLHDWSYESPGYEKGSANFSPILGTSSNSAGSGQNMKFRSWWNLTPPATFVHDISSKYNREIQHPFKVIEKILTKRENTVGGSLPEAIPLILRGDGQIIPKDNWSFITYDVWENPYFGDTRDTLFTDKDFWKFSTEGGHLKIDITPTVLYNNLHLVARLYNSNDEVLVEGTPLDNGHVVKQSSQFDINLEAGDYYIRVDPTGEPDNEHGKGYPVYGSVGYYQFAGSLTDDSITSIDLADKDHSNFSIGENETVKVLSMNGKILHTFKSSSTNINQAVDGLSLSPGTYILKTKQVNLQFQVK